MYTAVIGNCTLPSVHQNKYAYHRPPFKVIIILLTIFHILYFLAPWHYLLYNWKYAPLNPFHLFYPSLHPILVKIWELKSLLLIFVTTFQLNYKLPWRHTQINQFIKFHFFFLRAHFLEPSVPKQTRARAAASLLRWESTASWIPCYSLHWFPMFRWRPSLWRCGPITISEWSSK